MINVLYLVNDLVIFDVIVACWEPSGMKVALHWYESFIVLVLPLLNLCDGIIFQSLLNLPNDIYVGIAKLMEKTWCSAAALGVPPFHGKWNSIECWVHSLSHRRTVSSWCWLLARKIHVWAWKYPSPSHKRTSHPLVYFLNRPHIMNFTGEFWGMFWYLFMLSDSLTIAVNSKFSLVA